MRTTPILSILTALALVGCPSPPDPQDGNGQATTGPEGTAGPAGGDQAAPDGDEVADATGACLCVVNGNCKGKLRVDVVGTDTLPKDEGDPSKVTNAKDNLDPDGQGVRLLTAAMLDNVGDFSLYVPKGDYQMIEIAALCDMNSDGKITGGVDAISGPTDATNIKSDTSGIVLTLDKLPVPVAPEEGEPPAEATGASDERGHVPGPGEDPNAVVPPDDGDRPEGEPEGGPTAERAPPGPPPPGAPPAGSTEGGK